MNNPDVLAGIRNASLPQVGAGNHLMFYEKTKNMGIFDENGQPVFKTMMFVDVYTPGDRKNFVTYEVKDRPGINGQVLTKEQWLASKGWLEQFNKYKATKQASSELIDGTPLDQWPSITREFSEVLKFNKVYTVEQLAAAHDGVLAVIGPGAFDLREMARKWTSDAVNKGSATMMAVEIDKLNEQIAEQGRSEAEKDRRIAELERKLSSIAMNGAEPAAITAPAAPPEVERAPVVPDPRVPPQNIEPVADEGSSDELPAGFGEAVNETEE
ncbi:MAG: hypothetical protein KDJ90_00390 [Nitratireductor sp.]|nr:hypothetical protein [Nitratireductor sp.]